MLCGEPVDANALLAEARALGAARRLTVTGRIAADEMPAYHAAAGRGRQSELAAVPHDSSVVAPLAGRRQADHRDRPGACERRAVARSARLDGGGRPAARDAAGRPTDPVAVAIDILDEDHSLALAAARLAAEPALRIELGRAARRLWAARFTLDEMAAGYERAIENACRATYDEAHRARLPAHLAGA